MTGVIMTPAEKITDAFVKALHIEPSQVVDALEYGSIREWDSVAHMVLVAALEDAFGVLLDTDDIIALSSVAKTYEILRKYDVDC
jgi:acyl carrier protein